MKFDSCDDGRGVEALLDILRPLEAFGQDARTRRRRLLADIERLVGPVESAIVELKEAPAGSAPTQVGLPPRMQDTLRRLLAGDSEKQIAATLGRSKHTVHVYVKALYRHFGVCSRAELLARWVRA